MIRRHGALWRFCLALVDAGASVFLIGLISELRFGSNWRTFWGEVFSEPWAPALLLTLAWVLVLWSQGLYQLRARWTFGGNAAAMARAIGLMALLTFAGLFLFKLPDVSRLFLVVLLPAMAITSLLLRMAIRAYLMSPHRDGKNARYVLVIGSGPSAVRYVHELEAQPSLGLTVIGYLDGEEGQPSMGVPYLGEYDRVNEILHTAIVDEVAVCLDLAEWELISSFTELCRAEGKIVRLPIAGGLIGRSRPYVENVGGMPVLSLLDGPDRQLAMATKRILDLTGAAAALVLMAPILLAVAAYIQLKDGAPVLFRQTRLGVNGRPFTIYKFRTMVKDAEARYREVAHLSETRGAAFKMTDDPRVTLWGRILRKTSIDELPQLLNVLKGDMSLVGPRPAPPREVAGYDIWHRRRLTMKPGITGMWQISSRLDEDFDDRAKVDLEYIDRWSLLLDTQIALRTLPALIRSDGR